MREKSSHLLVDFYCGRGWAVPGLGNSQVKLKIKFGYLLQLSLIYAFMGQILTAPKPKSRGHSLKGSSHPGYSTSLLKVGPDRSRSP